MILRKKIVDGKEVFEQVSFDDAVKIDFAELVFTDQDEKRDFLKNVNKKDENEDLKEDLDDDDEKRSDSFGFDFNFNEFGEKFFGFSSKTSENSKVSKLIGVLPFLDKEDIRKIVDRIIENSEEYRDLNLISVMPFLPKEDADRLFVEFILEGENDNQKHLYSIAPFISTEALSKFVDRYLEGNYQDVNVDGLYPFMNKKDVKRVFEYIVNKKEEQW